MTHALNGASAPGAAAPEKGEAGTTTTVARPQIQTQQQHRDYQQDQVDRKVPDNGPAAFNALASRFAAIGYSLYPLHNDDLLLTWQGFHRVVPGFRAATSLLRQLGGNS